MFSVGPRRAVVPVEFGVEVEVNELDCAMCCELANDGEPRQECSGHHQDSVVVTPSSASARRTAHACVARPHRQKDDPHVGQMLRRRRALTPEPSFRHRAAANVPGLTDAVVAIFRNAPPIDADRFRADLDVIADQDAAPRG